jgi:hypothetical protein
MKIKIESYSPPFSRFTSTRCNLKVMIKGDDNQGERDIIYAMERGFRQVIADARRPRA